MLNPIELAWSGLENFVRKHNTSFRLSDVCYLARQWISALIAGDAIACIGHIVKVEEIFKESDRLIEQVEEAIIDEDHDNVSLEEGSVH